MRYLYWWIFCMGCVIAGCRWPNDIIIAKQWSVADFFLFLYFLWWPIYVSGLLYPLWWSRDGWQIILEFKLTSLCFNNWTRLALFYCFCYLFPHLLITMHNGSLILIEIEIVVVGANDYTYCSVNPFLTKVQRVWFGLL